MVLKNFHLCANTQILTAVGHWVSLEATFHKLGTNQSDIYHVNNLHTSAATAPVTVRTGGWMEMMHAQLGPFKGSGGYAAELRSNHLKVATSCPLI